MTATFILLFIFSTLPVRAFAASSRIKQIFVKLKQQSANSRNGPDFTEISEALEEEFLRLGQGQRYIESDDLASFKEWAIKINAEFKGRETYYRRYSRRLPEEDIDIVKASIVYNLSIRYRNVFRAYEDDWTSPRYRYLRDDLGGYLDLPHILKITTLKNYPLLLSLLDLNVGLTVNLNPPELQFTPSMVALLNKAANLPPNKISQIIGALERGKLVTRIYRPDHYGRKTHWWKETFPYIQCEDLLIGDYDQDILDLVFRANIQEE